MISGSFFSLEGLFYGIMAALKTCSVIVAGMIFLSTAKIEEIAEGLVKLLKDISELNESKIWDGFFLIPQINGYNKNHWEQSAKGIVLFVIHKANQFEGGRNGE